MEILRCLTNFTKNIHLYGTPKEKKELGDFELTTSVSGFVSRVLHAKQEDSQWHDSKCYHQTCESTESSLCGTDKLNTMFEQITRHFSDKQLLLFQHEKVRYSKPDGTLGYKFSREKTIRTLSDVLSLLSDKLFGKSLYIMHRYHMQLASKMRQDIHQNLTETDAICYTDYSREMDLTDQEQCKGEMFGASNITTQLIGQVYEIKVNIPSEPVNLSYITNTKSIHFERKKI